MMPGLLLCLLSCVNLFSIEKEPLEEPLLKRGTSVDFLKKMDSSEDVFSEESSFKDLKVEESSFHKKGFRAAHPMLVSLLGSLRKCQNLEQSAMGDPSIVTTPTRFKNLKGGEPIVELPRMSSYPLELIYDQGDIGSCTANAMAFIIRYLSVVNSRMPSLFVKNPEMLSISRLYQYYYSRYTGARFTDPTLINSYISSDQGASMTEGVISIDLYGCCPENSADKLINVNVPDFQTNPTLSFGGWPYSKPFWDRPDPDCMRFALDYDKDGLNDTTPFAKVNDRNPYSIVSRAIRYQDLATPFRLSNSSSSILTETEKNQLHTKITDSLKNGAPVYLGLMLDDSFFPDSLGRIPTPSLKTFSATGGHAMTIVGYGSYLKNDATPYYKLVNSWGTNLPGKGYLYFSRDYILNVKIFQIEAFSIWFDSKIWKNGY